MDEFALKRFPQPFLILLGMKFLEFESHEQLQLTEEITEVRRLFVMFHCNKHGVQKDKYDDEPIKDLRFHQMSHFESALNNCFVY